MYRNSEYYPDPTAGAALRQLYRKEKDLNTGKQFEADWKKSMPSDAWCYRLKDSAASYYGGNESLSFSIDNICDFDVYRYPMHHYFELKTIETPSIPLEKILGRFDRDKQKYHKLKHITDMAAAAAYRGQTAHVVINYTVARWTAPLRCPQAPCWTFCGPRPAKVFRGSGPPCTASRWSSTSCGCTGGMTWTGC